MSVPPPESVAPSDLVTRLASDARPTRQVEFPRQPPIGSEPYPPIFMRILRQSEILTAMASAEGFARLMLRDQKSPTDSAGYGDLYNEAKVCELLWFACRREDGAPTFINSQQLRALLTNDEVAVLFNAYVDWQAQSGPIIASMSEDEMDLWIDKLMEGLRRDPLPRHSLEARTDLLMRSVARLRRLEMANTSSTSRPSESTTPAAPSLAPDEAPPVPGV